MKGLLSQIGNFVDNNLGNFLYLRIVEGSMSKLT